MDRMGTLMIRSDVCADLAQMKPFSLLPKAEMERIAPSCSQRAINAGDVIYSEDQWVDYLWVLTAGLVRIAAQPPGGGQATVNIMRPGDLIGCLNGICRHRHPTEGMTLVDSSVIVIPKRRYQELLTHADFAQGIIHILGERLWESQSMRAIATQSSEKRLAWTLLWLHGKMGRRIPMTRRMIAETAGVARETSIRVLSPLEKKGWVKTRRGVLELLKPEKLRELLDAR